MISGPADDLAALGVDGDHHHDHPLLGQHPPVAQHPVADVADDAVDVEVAGRAPSPSKSMPVVVEHDRVAVLAQQDPVARRCPCCAASRAWLARWRYSPWTGMKHSGRATDSRIVQLALLGVAAHVHAARRRSGSPRRPAGAARR